MGQEKIERRFWTLSNHFMVRDEREFMQWIEEIKEANGDDLKIIIKKDAELSGKLNEMASVVNSIEDRKYLLRPLDTIFLSIYIEGEIPLVRMKSVRELNGDGEMDVEEAEVRDIDFLEELSGHLYEGETALITTVGVEPATFICAKGFIITSDGVALSPVPLPASLFNSASDKSKFPVSKITDH